MAAEKTNVMRVLDQKKIPYTPHSYHYDGGPVDGRTVAETLGVPPEMAYKTLVARGSGGSYYVFVVPVLLELDLKAGAKAAGEKAVEMIRQAELLPLTGYVHGGCSPVGMKKCFPTFLDESALEQETILVSGGKLGFQVELAPADLAKLVGAEVAPIAK